MYLFLRLKVRALDTAVIKLKIMCLLRKFLTFDRGWLHYLTRTLPSANDLHMQRNAKQFSICIPCCEGTLNLLLTALLHKLSYHS